MAHPILRTLLTALRERAVADYEAQLRPMVGRRGGFTKKQVDDFVSGARDGQSALVAHLVHAGILEIVDAPKREPQTDESGERTERAERNATEPRERS